MLERGSGAPAPTVENVGFSWPPSGVLPREHEKEFRTMRRIVRIMTVITTVRTDLRVSPGGHELRTEMREVASVLGLPLARRKDRLFASTAACAGMIIMKH